jgi:CBS domain-containing protein
MRSVGDVMVREVCICGRDDAMSFAARQMLQQARGSVVVLDRRSRRPTGIVTDRDLALATYTRGSPLQGLRVGQAMSSPVQTCRADDPLDSAAAAMARAGVRRLPVVDDSGRLVGIVSLSDLARAGLDISETLARISVSYGPAAAGREA